jgi:hypothetical protein
MIWLILLSKIFACDGGMTGKDIQLPLGKVSFSMTQEQFLNTISQFEKKLGSWVEKEYNKELVVFKSWSSNTINAFADQDDRKMMITIYGGVARFESMTTDSLSLVLCHELGHHLGGAPKKTTNQWSSAEGQADYYASMKCLKHLWDEEDVTVVTSPLVEKKCHETYTSEADQRRCHRIAKAGRELSLLFQFLEQESITPEFETPDQTIATHTELMHPYAQCRLDTYFSGVLCNRDPLELMDDYREDVAACHVKNGDIVGLRPACWYKNR